ncbi:hypothetical protein ACE38W_16860 [Chitinophaga sp. Hz27]|uniref:hypothetical protein n=1 Tax=Chitinophaga sp. Hz27 TaxID=3347169 RepID=UPI0035DEE1E4
MKLKIIFTILAFCLSSSMYGQQQQHYIFFLHNKWLQEHALNEAHPTYGVAEYNHILQKLEDKNTVVITEKRKPGTAETTYAMKVKKQVDSLIKKGILPENITVIGTSQGGYIAQYVSYFAKNPRLKFVFIGASFRDDDLEKDKNFKLYGKILSITEKSDEGQVPLSQEQRFIRSDIHSFKEITLTTGLHHGFLFKALDEWIAPAKQWAISK